LSGDIVGDCIGRCKYADRRCREIMIFGSNERIAPKKVTTSLFLFASVKYIAFSTSHEALTRCAEIDIGSRWDDVLD
jgi:hypothetical protein